MSIPVLSSEAMRAWEARSWAAGRDSCKVIARVGALLASKLMARTQPGERVLLLAGKGHNGDDVRAMIPWLVDRRVEVFSPQGNQDDLLKLEARLQTFPDWVVDGLFGLGLNRPPEGVWAEIIEAVNQSALPVIAVDMPSGWRPPGPGITHSCVIHASETWTVGACKQGMLAPGQAAYLGRLSVIGHIGLLPLSGTESDLHFVSAEDFDRFPPPRLANAHKGSQGWCALLAGSLGYHGAAVLATRGATCAQPGLVTLLAHESIYRVVAASLEAAMVQPWQQVPELPGKLSCLVVGPGLAASELGDAWYAKVGQWWRDLPVPMIVDASALDYLPKGRVVDHPRVITPHPGEAARLLDCRIQDIEADRPKALRELSALFGGTMVVLKGCHSLVGSSEGIITLNSSGNPYLAQGGAGDVLAGYLGGLLAQPAMQQDVLKTIRYGVWKHGLAAEALQEKYKGWDPSMLREFLA